MQGGKELFFLSSSEKDSEDEVDQAIIKHDTEDPERQASTSNEPTTDSSSNNTQGENDFREVGTDFLEAVRDAAVDASMGLLSALRWKAAETLTGSFPEDKRRELLLRLGDNGNGSDAKMGKGKDDPGSDARNKSDIDPPTLNPKDAEVTEVKERGSVQEEIAVSALEEARMEKSKWESEKVQLIKQMEEAANERVKNELKILRQRMEQDKKEIEKGLSMEKDIKTSIQQQQQAERDEMKKITSL